MKDVKAGINDRNQVFLEGTIRGTPRFNTSPSGKGCLNVTIDQRKYIGGEKRYFSVDVVLFEPMCDMYKEVLKDGMFIYTENHLIRQPITVGEGESAKTVYTQKPVCSFLQFEEN